MTMLKVPASASASISGGIAHPIEQAVAGVQRVVAQVHLGDQRLDAGPGNREMDVRRAPRVGHRFDGAEAIAAVAIRDRAAITLEVGVGPAAAVVRVVIVSGGVALPDLHPQIAQGNGISVRHLSEDMGDPARCGRRPALHAGQVVVGIERDL
jgi:hypothetical protein